MKITHIVPSLESRHGGPSRSARGLSLGLAELGEDVTLLSTGPMSQVETIIGTRIETFRRGWPEVVCRCPALNHALQKEPGAIVHHHGLWLRTLHYAHQKSRRGGLPLVISPRGMMSSWAWHHHRRRKTWASRLLHPGALKAAAGWHATSDAEAADIRALGFTQPICVAGNGVTLPTESQLAEARTFWLGEFPDAATRPVALYYGRFHSKKRVLDLIDLWQKLAPPEWTLALVGIPSEYTVRELENYAARQPGSNRIEVFDGTNTPPPYAIASLFLLPSHSENFGLTVAESLASGVPALVTDTTPWQDMNGRGVGWCASWESFGEKLQAALALPEPERADMGRLGRSWVAQTFSWKQVAQPLAEFYRVLATQRST